MCGRYTVTTLDQIVAELDASLPEGFVFEPRYNAAPTQALPVVANREERQVELMRWGLIPSWADSPAIGNKMINARAETLASKPAFRDAFARRRCLVPADGFYEWKKEGKVSVPHYYHRTDGRPFCFAGLWDRWREPGHVWVISFTIVTADANPLVAPIHDRMPVIVEPDDYARWLSPEPLPPEALDDILVPSPANPCEIYPVSRRVSSPAPDDPQLIERELPVQTRLF